MDVAIRCLRSDARRCLPTGKRAISGFCSPRATAAALKLRRSTVARRVARLGPALWAALGQGDWRLALTPRNRLPYARVVAAFCGPCRSRQPEGGLST